METLDDLKFELNIYVNKRWAKSNSSVKKVFLEILQNLRKAPVSESLFW